MPHDDYTKSLDMPDQRDLLMMIDDAKKDSQPSMPCGLDHLRLMRVIREYGDRRYRAGFADASKITKEHLQ